MDFKDEIRRVALEFRKLSRTETIRVVSHLDADDICASSILIHALSLHDRKYSISIVNQLTEKELKSLSLENYKVYVFSDLGCGQLELIMKYLPDRTIFILDHHSYNTELPVSDNIHLLNPHKFGIDGTTEISGSGVVFFFARELDTRNERMSHIALIGAIGDMQENSGFSGLNKEILDIAIKVQKIELKKGLRWFGADTKPLYKLLAYSTDPYIPEISGSTSRAIQFLSDIGISPRDGEVWRRFSDLNPEEQKKLISAIIMKRVNETSPEDILGTTYHLPGEEEALRDAREFSTLLNACGRLNRASLGIGACLNDRDLKEKALSCLTDYKKEITNALSWYSMNKDSSDVITRPGFMIINAKENILPTIAGTMASILSKSGDIRPGVYIMSLARYNDATTKVSLRISGKEDSTIDLREIVKEITHRVGGEAGGHRNAAGAMIPTEKESEFIEAAVQVLSLKSMEEKVG